MAQRNQLYISQEGLCAWCTDPLDDDAEADHIVPWSEGGVTELWNLQLLCRLCHILKTAVDGNRIRNVNSEKDSEPS